MLARKPAKGKGSAEEKEPAKGKGTLEEKEPSTESSAQIDYEILSKMIIKLNLVELPRFEDLLK